MRSTSTLGWFIDELRHECVVASSGNDMMQAQADDGLVSGVNVLGDECRRHVLSMRQMLKYAREMSFRDPKRSVEALGQALDALGELSVDLELVLGGCGSTDLQQDGNRRGRDCRKQGLGSRGLAAARAS